MLVAFVRTFEGGVDVEEVLESFDVEEDGFIIQEEFGEEGEILAEDLFPARFISLTTLSLSAMK